MTKKVIEVISLGCSKNLVDSERLMKMLDEAGFRLAKPGEKRDIVVINTCGFIGDAKEESIEEILKAVKIKEEGDIESVCVMGCLSQRYADQLKTEIPEVDRWYGKFDWPALVGDLSKKQYANPVYDRKITTGPSNAYVKIAEGCNRFCSFCAIPLITGRFKSRPIEEILEEIKSLVKRGITEFNIIAQDLSSYGLDLYGKHSLAELIDRMAGITGVKWIRLHYAYPADFPYDILPVMARHPNVCKYLDIALQHISDKVLSNMRRHFDGKQTRELIARIRREVPGIHLRTTLMVGFPGEGDKEFDELMDFVRETRFERMGAFAYCEEEDTYGAKHFKDSIPQEVKQERLDKLMELQEQISLEIQESKIGQVMTVVIDREEDDYYIGRTEFDSPEVDPEVLVEKNMRLSPGQYVKVKITGAMPFELTAQKID
ncbi:MAG: 30S ribosomal protein S12 methylthiotransferase RimO [Muribaculaceae bacterium]|nr:30S ribosomal protein S12 methylthiotransferase RimO [Muribaculaceae bacterium]